MENDAVEIPCPEICASNILEASGIKLDPDVAAQLWGKILQHKWVLSEEHGRDVGLRTAIVDFLDSLDQVRKEHRDFRQKDKTLLVEMGAQTIDRGIWDTISDSQPPKQLIQKKIILPLKEQGLSQKHGVSPPKTIIFFGPPGTGKTHFVKAIAGVLSWSYIEILPSMLMADGVDKISTNLHNLLEKARSLEDVVIFIDEFEEIAASRETGARIDKSITNEFLKQVQLFKSQENKALLVCATNYIRQLDTALLRHGRFDCIIPVGVLDEESRRTMLQRYLTRLNAETVNLEALVKMTSRYTPADIEYLFQQVAQFAFEKEYAAGQDYRVTTDTFTQIVPKIQPSLTEEIIEAFLKDSIAYART